MSIDNGRRVEIERAEASATPTPHDQERATRAWPLVARREITVKLHDRNFLISTAVLVLLLAGSLAVQFLVAGHSSTTTVGVTSTTASRVVGQADSAARSVGSKARFEAKTYPSTAALQAAVRDGKRSVGLTSTGTGWRLIGTSDRNSDVSTFVGAAGQQDVVRRNAAAAGTSLQALSQGAQVRYDLLTPHGGKDSGTARIGGVAFGLLFYIASLLLGAAIANSVVEEKQNRVVEILAAAIPTRQLLIGKVLGNTALAVAQVVLLGLLGAVGLTVTGNADLLGQIAGGAGWFLAFFLLGFVTLACLWAVVGSLATRSEDIQSTSPPLTILVMGVFLIGILATGTFSAVVSFVPLLSTIAMPTRVVSGDASWWKALLSLAISIAASWLIVRTAERMYRNALLQTGRRMTFRQAFAHAAPTGRTTD